ncbi:hypothetical protein RRF57_002431 [Xylaria bambusicola]|uniref:Uncharacterized protein n=1 Tax=Xylaria bambusicola TaxID=326684 RepID=A0AAN7UIR2_9PEZI
MDKKSTVGEAQFTESTKGRSCGPRFPLTFVTKPEGRDASSDLFPVVRVLRLIGIGSVDPQTKAIRPIHERGVAIERHLQRVGSQLVDPFV